MKGIFLKLMFTTLKNDINFIMTNHFYLKESNSKNMFLIYMEKFKKSFTQEI